jgi:hypothetical protein
MNCQDFERTWNERIDASSSPAGKEGTSIRAADDRRALLEHAAACPTCRPKAAGYEALEAAILAWGQPPAPPAELANRILVAAQALPLGRPSLSERSSKPLSARHPAYPSIHIRRTVQLLAAAASIMAVVTVGLIARVAIDRSRGRIRLAAAITERPTGPASDRSGLPRLNEALASATEATLDLARSASEPAARLSLQLLDASTEPDIESASRSSSAISVPSWDSFTPDSAAAVATIQQVGDRLASGVRPLSSTARQAFSFLLGPAPPKPPTPANPPAARGA